MTAADVSKTKTFEQLGVAKPLVAVLNELGYEPSPIQEQSIPVLLAGRDILAQAQTGTGKTAAFALPLLTMLDFNQMQPQGLILVPTRELAIQVAEAFKTYAKKLPNFSVLPIYGGQEYTGQLKALKRGVHVVVGTPGRVMDHLRRGTLKCDQLKTLVLDEADEMLRMGFIEDVEWILQQIPGKHQTALFSATMPEFIIKITKNYLNQPEHIRIKSQTVTVSAIDQIAILVSKNHKVEALTRCLEMAEFDGVLIFTRTKTECGFLAEKLQARGYAAAPLNGDMNQAQREQVIRRLKNGSLDILVATDVAARGLDVERISHVYNYDMPYDAETYVHRIGRTGRAGRDGKAILFVTPQENRMLRNIERSIKTSIDIVSLPTTHELQAKRADQFTQKILATLANTDLDMHRELIEAIVHKTEYSELDIAAALASLIHERAQPKQISDRDLQKALEQEQIHIPRGRKPSKFNKRGPNKSGGRAKSK